MKRTRQSTYRQCTIYMTIGDGNRDNLLEKEEYVIFLNHLFSDAFVGLTFDQIPFRYQTFYNDLEENGGIDITGSKPGTTPTTEQGLFLQDLCNDAKDLFTETDPPSAPVASPTESPNSCSISSQSCYINLSIADSNADLLLDETEYVKLVNRLSDFIYAGVEFEDLSERLKENFSKFAPTGSIDIDGSKPGQNPSDSQESFLLDVCCDTDKAWQNQSPNTSPSNTPSMSPVDVPSGSPTSFYQECHLLLRSSDFNEDGFLNTVEFVRFVNRISTNNRFGNVLLEDLPCPLPDTYRDMASPNTQIYIDDLDLICEKVSIAIVESESCETKLPSTSPSKPPTQSPSQSPILSNKPSSLPSVAPSLPTILQQADVYNSFTIANTAGIEASDLQSGVYRNSLENVYRLFAIDSVVQLSSFGNDSRSLSQVTTSDVSYVPDSSWIVKVLDSKCPSDVDASAECQTVFASFQVFVKSTSTETISTQYTEATQNYIASGELQSILQTEDPTSVLRIWGASYPAKYEDAPTPMPQEASPTPISNPKTKSSSGSKALAAVLGTLLLLGLAWYIYKKKFKVRKTSDQHNDFSEPLPKTTLTSKFSGWVSKVTQRHKKTDDKPIDGKQSKRPNSGIGVKTFTDSDSDVEAGVNEIDEATETDDKDKVHLVPSISFDVFANFANFFKKKTAEKEVKDDQSDEDEEDDESKEENNFRNFKYDDSSDSDSDSDSSESEDDDSTKSPGWWGSISSGDSMRQTSAKDLSAKDFFLSDIIQKRVEDVVETTAKEESDSDSVSSESSGDHTYESDGSESRLPDEFSAHSSSSRNVAKDLKEDTTEDDMNESDAESNASDNSQDVAIRANYRKDVEGLIRLVLPNQLSKVDAMMARFKGREPELIATLQNMHHRTTKKMTGETTSNYSESRSEDRSQGSREVSEDGDSASRSYESDDSGEEESYDSRESESYYSSGSSEGYSSQASHVSGSGESRSFAEDSEEYDSSESETYYEEDDTESYDDTASDGD